MMTRAETDAKSNSQLQGEIQANKERQVRFKHEMSDNLKLCLRSVMQMNKKNPDSILIEDPVRRFIIEELRANNNRGDDRFTAGEFKSTLDTLQLGFSEEEIATLYTAADSEQTGLAELVKCINVVTDEVIHLLFFSLLFFFCLCFFNF